MEIIFNNKLILEVFSVTLQSYFPAVSILWRLVLGTIQTGVLDFVKVLVVGVVDDVAVVVDVSVDGVSQTSMTA